MESSVNFGKIEKYGIEWDESTPEVTIELKCYRYNDEYRKAGGRPRIRYEHLHRAVELLWTKGGLNNKCDFRISPWTDERIYSFCEEEFKPSDQHHMDWWGCSASGKAQPLSAIVYTPHGPKRMGDIKIGDRVTSQDGKTSQVIAVTDRGEMDEYKVSFNDGTFTLCAIDHLWEINRNGNMWSRSHIATTEWLMKNVKRGRYFIPLCKPVYFEQQHIDIDPYIMGALIGDGCFGGKNGNGSLRFSSNDDDIINEIKIRLHKGYELVKVQPQDYRIVKRSRRNNGSNIYIQALKKYDLWSKLSSEKHVPAEYLINSEKIRKEFLAGLLDTDGTCNKNGNISFTSTSYALATSIVSLVQSLGGVARISKKHPFYRQNGIKVNGQIAYNVSITMPDISFAFKCQRKLIRAKNSTIGLLRYINNVEKVGRSEMRCITVDHPNGLYLTNDFIVTHNSTDGAILILTHWLSAPDKTSCTICSTTKEMLHQRIWGEMVKYYSLYHGKLPGRYLSSKTQITLGDENSKNCIRGIAVLAGSAEEAKNNIIGVHNIYNLLSIDELQHPKMATAMDAITNLSTGCKEFKFLGMGNPDSWLNPLGIDSEPEGGKQVASTDKKGWPTKRGKCLYYDGLKSPGIVDPIEYPYLLQQRDIDKTINDFGEDHPNFWQMRRGFIPPAGLSNTVLTEAMLSSFGMQNNPEWTDVPVLCAGIDPAWSSGGNNCIIYPFLVGTAKPGLKVASFQKPYKVQFESSSKDALTIFLAKKLVEWCKANSIPPERVGMDTSVSQFMLADVMESDLFKFKGIYRCDFSGKASVDRVTENDSTMAYELYSNRVTELWYTLATLGRSGQIRQLNDYDTCRQFTTRRIKETGTKKICIESKRDMKARNNGNSPDEADAAVAGLAMAKARLGLIPTGIAKTMTQTPEEVEEFKRYDIDSKETYLKDYENNYTEPREEETIHDLSELI